MFVVRPAREQDLDALLRLAEQARPRLTNLPAHRRRLGGRIAQSITSLARAPAADQDGYYLFVLERHAEERTEVVGTGSLRARAGEGEAYYTWRRETLIHASQQLDVRREVAILSLSHELSSASLLCAFARDRSVAGTPAERLLRRARLLFLAQHPERFAAAVAAAMPGRLDGSVSPFWESVGRHFFARDYQAINAVAGVHSKAFIAECMPPFPLYEPLLSAAAREAIGAVHAAHEAAEADLRSEGFVDTRHVDLFDGGRVLQADRARLHSVHAARWHPLGIARRHADSTTCEPALVANQSVDEFRCILAPYARSATGQLRLDAERSQLLQSEPGQALLAVPLHAGPTRPASC